MRSRLPAALLAVPVLLITTLATAHATAPTPTLSWTPCADGRVQCASLAVPVDHDEPAGEKITLAIGRLPAQNPATRRGTIIFHSGGPAPMLDDESLTAAHLALLDDLRQWFDVVVFDSRGYGQSAALCDVAVAPQFGLFDGTAAEFADHRSGAAAYGASCLQQNPALATHAGSVDVAHDIDAIRVALGEEKIVFYGSSYGTVFGQEYARLYGDHLSRLFLDSTRDRSASYLEWQRNVALTEERDLADFARWCAAEPTCALHGTDPVAVWDQVVAAADANPLPGSGGRTLSGFQLRGLAGSLVADTRRATAAAALSAARTGDATALLDMAGPLPPAMDVGQLTECADFPVRPDDYGLLQAAGEDLRRTVAPRVGWIGPVQFSYKCAGWPIPASDPPPPGEVTGVPPALLVNSTLDATHNILDAQQVADRIPGSTVLPVIGYYHAVYLTQPDNRCVRDAVHAYLLDGTMPPAGTQCDAVLPIPPAGR
jgi:pimeloyl-ACP methyl ester carboxylesterase